MYILILLHKYIFFKYSKVNITTINNFYYFVRKILGKTGLPFFLQYVVVENVMTTSSPAGTADLMGLEAPVVFPTVTFEPSV